MGWALCAFVAVMAVQAPRVPGPIPLGWAELVFPLAALAFAARVARCGLRLPAAFVAAMGYVAWVAASAAAHRSGGWVALGALELALVMLMTATATAAERVAMVRTWIVAAAIVCVVGDVGALWALRGGDVAPLLAGAGELGLAIRPAGLCRSGMLAEFALVPLVLLVGDGTRLAGRWRWPLVALLAATVAATMTRTILAVAVALVVVGVARRPAWRGRAAIALTLLAAMALASLRLDVHGDGKMLRATSQAGIRWRIARSALARASAAPLVGVGPGAAAALAGWPGPDDAVQAWDAHSTLLDLAATRGLPALLLWLATAALVVRAARRRGEPLDAALYAALIATLFDGLTIDLEDARQVWVLFGLVTPLASRRP